MAKWISGIALCAGFFLLIPGSRAADIYISTNIQAAIDAAAPGDVIHLAAGKYPEILTISNKNLSIIGSGTNDCVIYNYQTNYVPLISITGPATVALSNFQLIGGQYQAGINWYNGFSPLGIVSTNATLIMNSLVINQIQNYFVTVTGGGVFATNVALWTVDIDTGSDVGFELNSCVASFDGLTQDAGHIDHTININNPPADFSDVIVVNSRIRASRLDYGNCVRTYCNSKLVVTNCYLYRGTDTNEDTVSTNAQLHDAVSVNGYTNNVFIVGNTIANLPWAIFCYGSGGGVQVLIESNSFINSISGGVFMDWMWYKAVDMGGGALGSRGGNVFSESPALLTNYCADVFYTNTSAIHPLANIFALHNTWSNPTNKEAVIWDKLDNPDYGRLITDDLAIKTVGTNADGHQVISWNERGAGEQYTVQTRSDLTTGSWANAPGSWPVINPSLTNDMVWTNSATVSSNVFYRIRSLVP